MKKLLTFRRKLSKTALSKRKICQRKGHKLHILRDGDGEIGAICSDYCKRCGYHFTRQEQEGIRDGNGIWTESLHTEDMKD